MLRKLILAAALVLMAGHAHAVTSRLQGSGDTTGTDPVLVLPAPGAGAFAYLTSVQCTNAGSVDALITLTNGAGGLRIWALTAFARNGFGFPFGNAVGGSELMTAGTGVYFQASVATGGTVTCNAQGYAGN